MMKFLFCLFILSFRAHALYEDQIEKFDWLQMYIGKVSFYELDHSKLEESSLFLASETHVLGALNQKNGSLVWRQSLEENARFSALRLCGKNLFSISIKDVVLLRVWNSRTGHILMELPVITKSDKGLLLCSIEQRKLFAVFPDIVLMMNIDSLAVSVEKSFPTELQKSTLLSASCERNKLLSIVLGDPESPNSLSLVHWNLHEVSGLQFASFKTPLDVRYDSCLLSSNILVCTGVKFNLPVLISSALQNQTWDVIELPSKPVELVEISDDRIFVKFSDNSGSVYKVARDLRLMYNIDSVSHLIVALDRILTFTQDPSKSFRNLQIRSLDLQSGLRVSCDLPEALTISAHHGRVREIAVLPGERGILVLTEDYALQRLTNKGEQAWLREEALAHITAVEMMDLPVSAHQATMQDEFGQTDAGIVELFVNRLRSQFTQLSVAMDSWWRTEKQSTENGDGAGNYRPLTRDSYNLHKMIVVVTAVGKIFGIESSRGQIMWEYLVPDTELFKPSLSHLFQQRTTGFFPLTPIASVLLKSKATGLPVFFYFDPINGLPLNAHTLKPVTSKLQPENAAAESVIMLEGDLSQAFLVPGPISESTGHIRPLCVLMTADYTARMLPEIISSRRDLLSDASGLFVYSINEEPVTLSGFRVAASTNNSSSSVYVAQPVWHIRLSPEDAPHRLLFAAAHASNEQVYSIGRVLGDRNVLYKYINPNILAVMTAGADVVHLHLVDVVVGQIIHSVVHQRASEPASLVVSENWVLYSVYNQRSLRSEFTILELFEPRHTTSALIPSPWQIFTQSLMPSRGDHLSRAIAKFSSNARAAHSAFDPADSKASGSLIPDILQRAFILSSPMRSGALAASRTERGITAKSLLFGLEAGNILELPKSILDPRRTLETTPQLQEEGLEAYSPELPLSTFAVISYNKTVERIHRIHTAPSGLESTSLVFAQGLDLFFTRIAPSKTYDMLRDDFDHWFIATIVLGMLIGSLVAHRLAARRELAKAWQ